jgi:hypothetical protein
VKQQSITIVRAVVDSELRKFHGFLLLRASRYEIADQLSPPSTLYV